MYIFQLLIIIYLRRKIFHFFDLSLSSRSQEQTQRGATSIRFTDLAIEVPLRMSSEAGSRSPLRFSSPLPSSLQLVLFLVLLCKVSQKNPGIEKNPGIVLRWSVSSQLYFPSPSCLFILLVSALFY